MPNLRTGYFEGIRKS